MKMPNNPFKKATKKVAKQTIDATYEAVKEDVKEKIEETKERLTSDDILPILIAGGVILIGIAMVKKPQPAIVKVEVKLTK